MPFPALESLLIGSILILPGFVHISIYEWLIPSPRRDFSKSIIELIGYGALNYVLLAPVIITRVASWIELSYAWWDFLIIFGIVVLIPVLAVGLRIRLSGSMKLAKMFGLEGSSSTPEPTAWDYFFRKQSHPCWVVIRLRNGETVLGLYGSNSMAGRYPNDQSLYLEAIHHPREDGGIGERAQGTNGALIQGKDIHLVEFFDLVDLEDQDD